MGWLGGLSRISCASQFSHSVVSDSSDPMDCSMPGFPAHHQLLDSMGSTSIESLMPSNHLILYCPLLLLPSIFPSIKVFSNEPVLCIRWPKYWSFSFSISPSSEYSGLISLLSKGLSRVFLNTTAGFNSLLIGFPNSILDSQYPFSPKSFKMQIILYLFPA